MESIHRSLINEILAYARMKSGCAYEICFADEMKSTRPVRAPDFIPVGDFITPGGFTHPTGGI
ncbi:MAG: hypothetical protein E7435_05495 [Ruminococcaceae bacterium]|nr:hypothetical protein [Oscillospiraceae bacterium]